MNDWGALLDAELGRLELLLSDTARSQLVTYLQLLDHWNDTINLTSLEAAPRVRRLVAEPLWAASQFDPQGRYLDVGSGNGSPGIPWCVACDLASGVLVEPRERRSVFLNVVLRKLGVRDVAVFWGRLEEFWGDSEAQEWVTVQGLRVDPELLSGIWARSPGARVVWFSRRPRSSIPPTRRIRVPGSDRELLLFDGPARTSSG